MQSCDITGNNMSKWTGRAAVVLAILALVPGIVPGAISVFGLGLSVLAMFLSLFSARANGPRYTWATVGITLAGVLMTNATLLVWDPVQMPFEIRLGGYALLLFTAVACMLIARRYDARKRGARTRKV